MDPRHYVPVPLNPKDAHADYLAGWLYSQVQAGPIDVETWNKGVKSAEAFQATRSRRAETAKNNSMAARRRTGKR